MLLLCREQELGATISTLESGIDIPMTRADRVILFGNVGAHCGAVIDGNRSVKKVRRHLLRIGVSKNVHTDRVFNVPSNDQLSHTGPRLKLSRDLPANLWRFPALTPVISLAVRSNRVTSIKSELMHIMVPPKIRI